MLTLLCSAVTQLDAGIIIGILLTVVETTLVALRLLRIFMPDGTKFAKYLDAVLLRGKTEIGEHTDDHKDHE